MKEIWRQAVPFGDSLMPAGTRLLLDDHFVVPRLGLSSLRPRMSQPPDLSCRQHSGEGEGTL